MSPKPTIVLHSQTTEVLDVSNVKCSPSFVPALFGEKKLVKHAGRLVHGVSGVYRVLPTLPEVLMISLL